MAKLKVKKDALFFVKTIYQPLILNALMSAIKDIKE